MKKIIALTLVLLMLVITTAFAQTEKEITFRDVQWGASYTEMAKKFPNYNFHDSHGKLYKTFSVDQVILDNGGIEYEYSDINVIADSYSPESQVAGYTTTAVKLFFAFTPVDGILTKELKDTAMYAAQYEFATTDIEAMAEDLTAKLTGLYGDPDKTDEGSNVWGTEFKYTYWYGGNDTGVVLIVHHPSVNTIFSEDSCQLVYYTRAGDTWLQEASDAEAYRESLGKNTNADSDDTSGL